MVDTKVISALKRIIKSLILCIHQGSALCDVINIRRDLDSKFPPVFIVGVPRSGTTLLYQIMMTAFKFAYIPNIANSWYMCPITATKFGLKRCKAYESNFSSTYGYEQGCMSPNEGGNIWNRWFPTENREGFNYTPADYLPQKNKINIKVFVNNIETLFNAPFLTKNVKMSVRIAALAQIFCNPLFVFIRRDPLFSALSLLTVRRKMKKEWWSVLPKEYEEIKNLEEYEQVCYQVFYTEQNIINDLQKFASSNFLSITYESLCKEPLEVIEKISAFLNKNKSHVQRTETRIPNYFNLSVAPKTELISFMEKEKMHDLLLKLYGKQSVRK